MLSWLILIVGAALAIALVVPPRRDAGAGVWLSVFAIVGVTLWLSGQVREKAPAPAAAPQDTTRMPTSRALQRPSPFADNAARDPGAPMTPDPAR
ncbi:hypothetical protein MKI84_09470 [Ancylobacter sp. A5.8]|uniref:hypothetical protein n=1 Tax=Ancylobacter gelatini TaxID=2919920 RepID=UPI001F4DC576|nr:hypothetical protein [Ancylobacter gelatini]MCJ8143148.1 hypothetical protein [Ancylobacter gelatini]